LALAGQDTHGTVSALSREYDISRPTVYEARAAAQQVLTEHFTKPESAVWVEVDEAQLNRAVVALRLMAPNTIRPIEELLPILYPGVKRSYGTVHSKLMGAQGKAREFNLRADMSGVSAGALDEMYSQGDPVLAGVDLDSGCLFALELCETRSGAEWARVLEQSKGQGLALSVVVKDAAKGIEAGVREVFPEAEQRDDCFHALYELNKVPPPTRATRLRRHRARGRDARPAQADSRPGR